MKDIQDYERTRVEEKLLMKLQEAEEAIKDGKFRNKHTIHKTVCLLQKSKNKRWGGINQRYYCLSNNNASFFFLSTTFATIVTTNAQPIAATMAITNASPFPSFAINGASTAGT